jgi:hypothetical protein
MRVFVTEAARMICRILNELGISWERIFVRG